MKGWSGSPMNQNSPMKQGGMEICPECGEIFEGQDAFAQMAQHIHEAHLGGGPGTGTPGYVPHDDPTGWDPGDPTGTADDPVLDDERTRTPQ